MISNLSLITPLLNFDDPNDFYMLYIFKRKKDQPVGEKKSSQSVRTIKTYTIDSIDYLHKRWEEIVQLSELFKARAYIHVNKLNHKTIGLLMMERLALNIRNGVLKQQNLFDSVVGELHSTEKRWIVDIDILDPDYVQRMESKLHFYDPIGSKVIVRIPTLNGYHLITSPFNVQQFKQDYPGVDIHKHNPTLLYLPNSLQ